MLAEAKENESSDEFILEKRGDMSCAICLIDYEEGDQICFSHNPSCKHHFHRECIMSWLKNHDACPCCRQDYLSFGDDYDNDYDEEHHQERESPTDQISPNDNDVETAIQGNETRHTQLDRLYGTGGFEINEEATTSTLLNGVEVGPQEPWEVRLERAMERLRRQVEEQVQVARTHLRERREDHRQRRDEQDYEGDEGRVERSIQVVRGQLNRLREVASREIQLRQDREHSSNSSRTTGQEGRNREDRWEDAMQVVRSRLHDIAHSEQANRIRERSTRSVQSLIRHATNKRR